MQSQEDSQLVCRLKNPKVACLGNRPMDKEFDTHLFYRDLQWQDTFDLLVLGTYRVNAKAIFLAYLATVRKEMTKITL